MDTPDINSFLDAQETPAPAEASETTTSVPSEGTPVVETGEAPAPEADKFDRDYVESLRRESASYRTKAKELEEQYAAFAAYGDEDRAVWSQLAKTMAEDPKAGAEYMRRIADAALADFNESDAPAEAPEPQYLTKADYEKLRTEERQAADVARIEAEATSLGYAPESREYVNLLLVAQHETKGDIKAAHAHLQGERQKIIDAFLAQKAAEAEGSPAAPGGPTGAAPSGERDIVSFADARAALEAHIAAGFGK